MSNDRIRTFRIEEDDLTALESNLSLICMEGIDWPSLNNRPDLREAWEMTIKTLSKVRFNYGPPQSAERVD
jgi:hypothetical protein